MVDSEIAICSRDVLNFFTDNFDCPDLYDDYINEVQSSEIIDDRILSYEMDPSSYYARVLDPRTYGAITQDILSRYLHPMVVDSKLLCPKSNYVFQYFNKYFDQGVQVALNTTVTNNSQIGMFSKVGTNSLIDRSTIGEKSVIGKNVKIRNSFIWNNVEIQDNVEIEDAIIADNVVIKKGAKIGSGSMISFGVIVKEGVVVLPASTVSKFTYNSDTLEFEKVKKFDELLFENAVISYIPRECKLQQCELLGQGNVYANDEDSDLDEDDDDEEDNDREMFEKETKDTLERCVKNKFSISNASMEVKNLKMTYNMEYSDCVEASFPVLMGIIAQSEGSDEAAKRAKNIQTILTEWKPFLKDFVREVADQFTLVRQAEIQSSVIPIFNNSFHIIIQVLFTLKVLQASVIQQWSQRAEQSLKETDDDKKDDIF